MATTTTIVPLATYKVGTGTWQGSLPAGVSTVMLELVIPKQAGGGEATATLFDSPDGGVTWRWRADADGGAAGCDSVFVEEGLSPTVKVDYAVVNHNLQLQVNATF